MLAALVAKHETHVSMVTQQHRLCLLHCTGKRDLQFEKVISDVTADMKLTRDDDFTLRVVQLSELLAIRHCVFLMGPTGSGRSEVYKVGWRTCTRGGCGDLWAWAMSCTNSTAGIITTPYNI
jgi:hypothetical protein